MKSFRAELLAPVSFVAIVNADMDIRLSSMTSTRIMESTFCIVVLFRAWFILVIPFDTFFPAVLGPLCRKMGAARHTVLILL